MHFTDFKFRVWITISFNYDVINLSETGPGEDGWFYEPLARYVKLRVARVSGMPGTFSLPPRISDPDMHHGTCLDACRDHWLSISFEVSGRENVAGIPGACATRSFTYVERDQYRSYFAILSLWLRKCEWRQFGTFSFKVPCIAPIYAWFLMHFTINHSDSHTNHICNARQASAELIMTYHQTDPGPLFTKR